MKRIALVTCKKYPRLSSDDQLLIKPLRLSGFDPFPVIWNDHKVDWKQFTMIIIRSCWDYHEHIEDFKCWLYQMNHLKIPFYNPVSIIESNIDKFEQYKIFQKQQISCIPTILIEKTEQETLAEKMVRGNLYTVVVKPRYGGSGIGIFKTDLTTVSIYEKQFGKILNSGDVLIQPFIREIKEGEYSFIFIGGHFTHCVLKKPRRGDFLTQGGICEKITPSQNLIKQATNIYKTIKTPLLYARIDAINVNGKLTVVELELCDPMLFFGWDLPSLVTMMSSLKRMV